MGDELYMTIVTLRLPENVVHEMEENSRNLKMSRTAYIKKAIEAMNNEIQKNERRKKLIRASQRVRKESMHVNQEFSVIEI